MARRGNGRQHRRMGTIVLTVTQAADRLGLKPDAIRKMIRAGKLDAVYMHGYYVKEQDADSVEVKRVGRPRKEIENV